MKLQPNFSWQKYEGKEEDQKEQFQYQLQQSHMLVSNSINSTVDDESFFLRERMTSFTWIDNKPIWRKTITGTIVGTALTPYSLGATMNTLVNMIATAQNAVPMTVNAITFPYFDGGGNNISIISSPTQVFINAANNAFAGYTFYITVFYTK